MRRIIGQCSQSDLVQIRHLAKHMTRVKDLDTNKLTKNQKTAVIIILFLQAKHVGPKLMRVIREVLVWLENDKGLPSFEFKFFSNPNDPHLEDDVLKVKKSIQ
jgi:hypothetical protein